MDQFSYLSNAGPQYVDQLFQQYQADPTSVDREWARFFEGFLFARQNYGEPEATPASAGGELTKELQVFQLIYAYRSRGHLFADINPLSPPKTEEPDLSLGNFGLTEADLDTTFQAGQHVGLGPAPLRKIIELLQNTYCGSIGVEYKYIRIPEIVEWMEQRMESSQNRANFNREEKKHILHKLMQATQFEQFLGRKFVGQKRFSLEGLESLIPGLDGIIRHGSTNGIKEFVLGMAHRGRLNVLCNIMEKEYDEIFAQFIGKGIADDVFDGDVKYHLGNSSDVDLGEGRKVHLSLTNNPSHLEAVDPVVVGIARSKMDLAYGGDKNKICPLLLHGDAALAGQGVVYELIQMSRLAGYQVGGSIHIVTNNQLGFTTDPEDGRSSTYCTDVGKVTLSPVFHVRGDDPEALVHVTKLAMDFRQQFNREVFIDIIGYRKYGHNEGDEPRFTQPQLYTAIDSQKPAYHSYQQRLIAEGSITQDEVKAMEKAIKDHLNDEYDQSKEFEYKLDGKPKRFWEGLEFYDDDDLEDNPDTTVSENLIKSLASQVSQLPESFNPHRNIGRVFEQRSQMVEKDTFDWGMAETLAYASLLTENHNIRISGQDCERGTFSHRHAVVTDNKTGEKYIPLNNLEAEGMQPDSQLHIYNSLLSEFAVMGFEYGYASTAPNTLTVWEAQYGDFFNGAQIIIDQFLSSSKSKWQRMNGLVLYLPHGYEGGGPEHSSARIERFLTLCAQNNMYVANFTTPANLFHALRRQLNMQSRRPLIIFTPKSLLRYPKCVSSLADFTQGGLQELILDEAAAQKPEQVKRVVFCSGKIYYDLLEAREKFEKQDVALIRVEQLYPLPVDQMEAAIKQFPKAKAHLWVQEEPLNQGAWPFILRKFESTRLEPVGRKESASPATGSLEQHVSQQQYIVKKSLDLAPDTVLA